MIHNGGNQRVSCIGPQCALAPGVFVRGRHPGRCRARRCEQRAWRFVQGRTWCAAAKAKAAALSAVGKKEP